MMMDSVHRGGREVTVGVDLETTGVDVTLGVGEVPASAQEEPPSLLTPQEYMKQI